MELLLSNGPKVDFLQPQVSIKSKDSSKSSTRSWTSSPWTSAGTSTTPRSSSGPGSHPLDTTTSKLEIGPAWKLRISTSNWGKSDANTTLDGSTYAMRRIGYCNWLKMFSWKSKGLHSDPMLPTKSWRRPIENSIFLSSMSDWPSPSRLTSQGHLAAWHLITKLIL